jgi:DNA-binding CsgD family transcriptional regulator/catechol 2,3-dioxygenase-like lactoylglutathione lyase family enzyme
MAKSAVRGRPPYPDVLTPAEWRVVEAVRHGLGNRAIARRMDISLDAVKFHVSNALSKLGMSARAQLRSWDGVRRASALAKTGGSVDSNSAKIGALGQISRSVSDIEAARRWYGEVLGLEHLYSFGDLAFFDCGGVRLMLAQGESSASAILYFRVGDIRLAHDALTKRGATFINAPHMIHRHADGMEEWMAFFNDCDGRPLAIMSQVRPGDGRSLTDHS